MSDTTDDRTAPDDEPGPRVGPSIAEVDAEIRAKLTGRSVQTVAEQSERAFATIGVQLTGEQLAAYAETVSEGSAFAIEQVVAVEH